MIILILLLIITILSGFIIWLLRVFFTIEPQKDIESELKQSDIKAKKAEVVSSVVGTTSYEPLIPPPPKPKKVIPSEEIDDAFMNNEFDGEYEAEPEMPTELPEEEKSEVVDVEEDEANGENQKIQDHLCYDYYQLDSAIHNVVRNKPLTDENAKVLLDIEGTDIGTQFGRVYPNYLQDAIAALANIEH